MMRPHPYLTFGLPLLLAVSGLVSCKEKTDSDETGSSETPQTTEATPIGTLEGKLGDKPISITLNEQDSQWTIETWDGLSNKRTQRDSGELSLEAFLMGTDLWSGPPRLLTLTHDDDAISLTLRFAGRLAVDEKLISLPGCLIERNGMPLVPAPNGTWTTAKNVTLPRYDLSLQVKSFDETGGTMTGVISGQLIDPTTTDPTPMPIDLQVSLAKTPEPVSEPASSPVTDEAVTAAEPPVASSREEVPPAPDQIPPDENAMPIPPETTPTDNGGVEIRPAIPAGSPFENQ